MEQNKSQNRNRRFTSAMKQELISRCQLSERLIDFGWLPNDTILDLGEDFIVQIYLDYQATGATFQIQEKSISNLYERRSKKGDCLIYPFSVDDLKHWETFDFPVVLVVWDVDLRQGSWILVSDAIAELEQRRPKWRSNKSRANVHIPWDNTTDNLGLAKLKQRIGHCLYPLIARDETVEMKVAFSFPDTEDGGANREAWERFVREGEEATFRGETIRSIEFSGWFGRWFGDYDSDDVVLTVGTQPSPPAQTVGIDVVSNNGEIVSLSNIELRMVKRGTDSITVTNEHQVYPVHFSFILRDPKRFNECTFSCRVKNFGRHACESLSIFRFLRALTKGGKLTITFLELDTVLTLLVPPQQTDAPFLLNQQQIELVENLCDIQSKIGQIVRIPEDGIKSTDVRVIRKLVQILERGQVLARHKEATIRSDSQIVEFALESKREGQQFCVQISPEEVTFSLFGMEIPIGKAVATVRGTVKASVNQLEETMSLSPEDSATIELVDVEIEETFPDIIERISTIQKQSNAP